MLALFDPPVTVIVVLAVALPVSIVTSPPVLLLALLPPVDAVVLMFKVTPKSFDWFTVVLLLLVMLAVLFESTPLPEMVTVVSAKAAGAIKLNIRAVDAIAVPTLY